MYVGNLIEGAPGDGKQLLATGFNAIHVPASDAGASALVFLRDAASVRAAVRRTAARASRAAVQLADRVGSILDYGFFSASPSVLVYREPDPLYQLTWFDCDGRELGRVGTPEPVAGLALSPAGDRALVAKHVPHNVVDQDLWLFNLARNENPTRLTSAASLESWPAWLTNDRFAVRGGWRGDAIYQQTIGNERLAASGSRASVRAASPPPTADASPCSSAGPTPKTGLDLWVWTGNGPPGGVPLNHGGGTPSAAATVV